MPTVDELIRKLEEGSSMQRQHAAQELGKLGDPKAIEPLVRILQDKLHEELEDELCK
jgi:HEAT repeat protein